MQKILSIDWDYFFPNSANYDFGANEELAIYREIVWATRCYAKSYLTKKEILEEYKPDIPSNFWSIITNKPKLFIADSHFYIWKILKYNDSITSLDAHHDLGYRDIEASLDSDRVTCANWANWAILIHNAKLYLHYPKWRKKDKEYFLSEKPLTVSYTLPEPQDYDIVFICRSSCWTPPWYDEKFKQFYFHLKVEPTILEDFVTKIRGPSMKEAKAIRNQQKEFMDKYFKDKKERFI